MFCLGVGVGVPERVWGTPYASYSSLLNPNQLN